MERGVVRKKKTELFIEGLLAFSAFITILITLAIIWSLISQSIGFFEEVSLWSFLTDTQWTPLFTQKHYGILPLLSGTFLTTFIAIIIAAPLGLVIAVYLSEYAHKKFRLYIKPTLELLAAVPTVVYGFFALTVVTPFLKDIFPGVESFNALSAGIVMGIMIIPFITSMSEDALYAVPKSLREASYGMGATRFQTAFKVVVPAASSGIIVSIILGIARAIGETMIVAIAAGQQPILTLDPRKGVETVTAYIVQVSLGDVPHGSLEYQTIFAAGITLFVLTFILNSIGYRIKKNYQKKYA
jgi:phosphate transport system permease protein